VENINPNQITMNSGGTKNVKMVVLVHTVDAPGETCDPGEFSEPTKINLTMVDGDGIEIVDNGKTVVCKHTDESFNVKRTVIIKSPENCEGGVVPPPRPDFSLGIITSTGSAFVSDGDGGWVPNGAAPYEEDTEIKCFE
jgi:hypothetical protein